MRNLSLSLCLFSLLLSGCDAPSGGRARSRAIANTSLSSSGVNGTGTNFSGSDSGTNNNNNNNNGSNLGSGYESCDLNAVKSTAAFQLSICQSTNDETKFKVKFVNTDQSAPTCFVPTYKSQDGSSIYLGQAQCTLHTAAQVMDGTFVKNRQGYSQSLLNGTMIMKYSRLNDYYACMDAIPNFVANNCPQNPNYCMAAATSFRDQVCGYFMQQGNYLDVRLK